MLKKGKQTSKTYMLNKIILTFFKEIKLNSKRSVCG